MQTLSIVIPCCNEEDALALLPARLFPVLGELSRRYLVELVFVDDGSSDDTWILLSSLAGTDAPGKVVLGKHPHNLGLGAALQTGRGLASGSIIVMLDADGTYPFSIVEPLVAAVASGADIATASPYHVDGHVEGVSALRLLFSRGASILYRMLVDRKVATYTAMVRAYRIEAIVDADANDPGFLYVAKLLVEGRRRGAQIVEIPAVLSRREFGVSKARVFRITRAHLGYMAHLIRLRLTGQFWVPATPRKLSDSREVVGHAVD